MNYLSKNIKFLRQVNHLTQEQLAKIVGKTRTLICAWESDDRNITTEDIIKISDHFNIPMDKLVGTDLANTDSNETFDELEVLFNKNKDILTDDDKEMIKFMIEKRKKEIDKQLGEE